jgi:hypothetical protein
MLSIDDVEAEVLRVFADQALLATSERIDRAAKDRAVDAVLAAVPVTFDRNDRAELDASMPLGYAAEWCASPRVTVARSRLTAKHLHRGEIVYLAIRFSDLAPWWRATWHAYRGVGNSVRHTAHELSDRAFLAGRPGLAVVAARVARAADEHGWLAVPPEVESRRVRPRGWSGEVPLSDLVFWGA